MENFLQDLDSIAGTDLEKKYKGMKSILLRRPRLISVYLSAYSLICLVLWFYLPDWLQLGYKKVFGFLHKVPVLENNITISGTMQIVLFLLKYIILIWLVYLELKLSMSVYNILEKANYPKCKKLLNIITIGLCMTVIFISIAIGSTIWRYSLSVIMYTPLLWISILIYILVSSVFLTKCKKVNK